MRIIDYFKKQRLLLLIIITASILRLWDLSNYPPHLRNDEAAIGYSAYSVLNTGRDEHGEAFPLIFKSFGDWKMGLYVYLTIPFIAIFGLNEWAVRLPSALAGILAVPLIFALIKELFKEKTAAYWGAFLLSVSPILVPFSRGAWEVNVTFTLTLAGIYFFLRAFRTSAFLVFSSIFFGLTLISSHGAKFSTPVILALLVAVYFQDFKKTRFKQILFCGLILFLFSFPVLFSFIEGKVSRLATLSIFSYPSSSESAVPYYTKAILSRFFSLFSIKTLFLKGDLNPQHGAPDSGPFLLVDMALIFLGFIKLLRGSFRKQSILVLLLIPLLALPSALTIEKANFERVLTLFIPFILVEALGAAYFLEKVKGRKWLVGVFMALYLVNYIYFMDQYLIHNPKKNDAWQYGYKQIVEKITPLQNKYNKIIVQQSLEQPYIFFLFYQKYDPLKFQSVVGEVFIDNKEGKDMGLVKNIDNIFFGDIDWKEKQESNTLYVMPKYMLDRESKIQSYFKEIDTVYDLNGFPLFKLVEKI